MEAGAGIAPAGHQSLSNKELPIAWVTWQGCDSNSASVRPFNDSGMCGIYFLIASINANSGGVRRMG